MKAKKYWVLAAATVLVLCLAGLRAANDGTPVLEEYQRDSLIGLQGLYVLAGSPAPDFEKFEQEVGLTTQILTNDIQLNFR